MKAAADIGMLIQITAVNEWYFVVRFYLEEKFTLFRIINCLCMYMSCNYMYYTVFYGVVHCLFQLCSIGEKSIIDGIIDKGAQVTGALNYKLLQSRYIGCLGELTSLHVWKKTFLFAQHF